MSLPVTAHTPDPARGWTPERKARFLDHLAAKGNVRAACLRVGLSPEAAYRLRRRDDLFARGWALALGLARTCAEQVLADRAIEGVEEPVYYRGELVGSRRRFDARLLLAHLARLDRLVEENEASEEAGRFDELLALIAGEEVPAGLADEDAPLPLAREAYADRAARQADAEVRYAPAEETGPREEKDWDDPDWGLDDEDEEEIDEEAFYELEHACEAARSEARRQAEREWDEWRGRACGVIDALSGWPGAPVAPGLPGHPLPLPAAPAGPVAPLLSFPRTASTPSTSALARVLAGPVRSFVPPPPPRLRAGC